MNMCGGHGVSAAVPGAVAEAESGSIRSMSLCLDQAEWLERVVKEHSQSSQHSPWHMLEKLIEVANREPSQTKRIIFLQVRCHRCLQHSRGGDKRDYDVELSEQKWQWLENVRQRSKHPTLGKTLRILMDFYKPICEKDAKFEHAMFAAAEENDASSTQGNGCVLESKEKQQAATPTESTPLQKDLSNIEIKDGYATPKVDKPQLKTAAEVQVE